MHSQAERLSPEDQAYALERVKQLTAMSRDPHARELLAEQIFADAFTHEVPQHSAVKNRHGVGMAGHARRDTVPDLPPPPAAPLTPDDTRAKLLEQEYCEALKRRAEVIHANERKMRSLLWARAVFLDGCKPAKAERDPTPEETESEFKAETLESAIREWYACSLPTLPTDTAGIELLTRANAKASWGLLQRVRREREAQQAAAARG